MAGEGIFDFLGTAGNIASGVKTWERLFKGDVLGAITSGIFGGSSDRNLPLGFKSYRNFGSFIVPQTHSITAYINDVYKDLTKAEVPKSDKVWGELERLNTAMYHSNSPQDAINRNTAAGQAADNALRGIAVFEKQRDIPPSDPSGFRGIDRVARGTGRGIVRGAVRGIVHGVASGGGRGGGGRIRLPLPRISGRSIESEAINLNTRGVELGQAKPFDTESGVPSIGQTQTPGGRFAHRERSLALPNSKKRIPLGQSSLTLS